MSALSSVSRAQVPVYEVTPVESAIKFGVDSSVSIKGSFDEWKATMKFSSTDVRNGILDIEIQADSVNTGSRMKDNKLKGKDFFNAKESPIISFKSTKVVQTGPNTFELEGDFTIRGVTRKEKLTLLDNGKGSASGSVDGTMAFDRKDYGMNSGIPFIKVANRVEVSVSLKGKRRQRTSSSFSAIEQDSAKPETRHTLGPRNERTVVSKFSQRLEPAIALRASLS